MECNEFCDSLKLCESFRQALVPAWNELTDDWSAGELPFYFTEEYFKQVYPLCNGPFSMDEIMPYVKEAIRITAANPMLALLAHICYKGAFVLEKPVFFKDFPDELPELGLKYVGVYNLMVAMGIYPLLKKAHAKLGLPEHYANDTMAWIGGTMAQYRERTNGLPGRRMQMSWMARWLKNELFRIGRFEYLIMPIESWLSIILRNDAGQVVALCRDGWRFREDGYRAGDDEEAAFTTELTETQTTITGTLVPPDGMPITSKQVTLDKSQWHPVATYWDMCPTIHIPGGMPMPFEVIKSSLQQAREFFRTYFHREVPFFYISSWVLNPVWETLLQNSNIVRFRRELYAIPTISWGKKGGLAFIFGRDDVPPDELPAHNTMQFAMQEAHRRNKMGGGAVFVLAEDIDKLGNEYYRRQFKDITL